MSLVVLLTSILFSVLSDLEACETLRITLESVSVVIEPWLSIVLITSSLPMIWREANLFKR